MFLVEPMVAKMLLPQFGGSPNVWNTCVVFFQLVLIAGYLYGHFITNRLNSNWQTGIHLSLVAVAAMMLPIRLNATGVMYEHPIASLFALLVVLVGFPFFIISTTVPTISKWYSSVSMDCSVEPYMLYAASNAGGVIGLLSYPFLIEPNFRLAQQTQIVTALFVGYALCVAACAFLMLKNSVSEKKTVDAQETNLETSENKPLIAVAETPVAGTTDAKTPTVKTPASMDYCYWLVLALIPQSLVLGFTTYVTSELSAIPLFWIIPLLIYLFSFVIAFSQVPSVIQKSFKIAAFVSIILTAILLSAGSYAFEENLLIAGLSVQLITLFFVCCACHMELAVRRPNVAFLTSFYLTISIGGVMGSVINTFVAPELFRDYIEYPIMLVAAGLLLAQNTAGRTALRACLAIVGLLVFIEWCIAPDVVVYQTRNFYGCISLWLNRAENTCEFFHGHTLHGSESLDPDERGVPTSYYVPSGPIGRLCSDLFGPPETMRSLAKRENTAGSSAIAVIGLGTGTIAAYAKEKQPIVFYEIDPDVVDVASNPIYFTYLYQAKKRGVDLRIVKGDGRLEIQKAPYNRFRMILVDAFSSDSIPMHLITREALAIYQSKLKKDGLIVFNISNHFYDLRPVLHSLSRDAKLTAYTIDDRNAPLEPRQASASWVVLTSSDSVQDLLKKSGWKLLDVDRDLEPWTDDFCSPLSVLYSPMS